MYVQEPSGVVGDAKLDRSGKEEHELRADTNIVDLNETGEKVDPTEVQALQEKVADLQSRNDELQRIGKSLEPLVAEAHLRDNDALVAFYTGLPSFSLLMTIYFHHIASPAILDTARTRLSKFQQFMAVLTKLRLGLTDQDIAYHFRFSQPTLCRNFKKWIDAMYICLKPLVVWPDCDDFQKTICRWSFGHNLVNVLLSQIAL